MEQDEAGADRPGSDTGPPDGAGRPDGLEAALDDTAEPVAVAARAAGSVTRGLRRAAGAADAAELLAAARAGDVAMFTEDDRLAAYSAPDGDAALNGDGAG